MKVIKNNGKKALIDLLISSGSPVTIDVTNFVFSETPSGAINGVNATFTTSFNFVPESVEVFNGIKLNLVDDYTTIGNNTIQLTYSPLSGEKLIVNYIKV